MIDKKVFNIRQIFVMFVYIFMGVMKTVTVNNLSHFPIPSDKLFKILITLRSCIDR